MQLNYFPIIFEFENYQISTEPYVEGRISELRGLHNSTHSFFRNDDLIYISNKEHPEELFLGKPVERNLFKDYSVTSSLIKHIFFRTFKERFPDYTPTDFYPFRFFSEQTKDDIIYDVLPSHLQNKISYKKLIEVQLRQTEINGQKRFGFIISIKRNWVFEKSCRQLHNEGFDLQGLDVLHSEILPGLEGILAPNEEFLGVLTEVDGTNGIVTTSLGLDKFPLDELSIRKTKFNIGSYLSHTISEDKSNQIFKIIENKKEEILNAKNLCGEINKIARALFSDKRIPIMFQNKDGFCFRVSEDPLQVTNTIDVKSPTFIFDYAATKTHVSNPDVGLTNYGPYDSINFDIKSPIVLCICHGANRGDFTNFLYSLKNGIPSSKYFQKGLLKKYELQEVIFDIKEIQNHTIEDYIAIIKDNDDNTPHLAIIEIPYSFRRLDVQSNPYYKIKAKLLSLEIPVQFVTSEIIQSYNEYILNSIGLQIYAKLGGTPWVLPSQRSVDHEIIIGIGHSWTRNNQFKGSENNRVVGITTFLSSDGQYLLGDKVKNVLFEEYFSELLKSLKNSISKLSSEQGWSKGDTVRLIFHIFKPIKNTEFDVVSQLIKDTPDYNIKFAFVTLSKYHPNILFDPKQKGISKYGNSVKGEYIPNRGSTVFLDSETALIQMFGAFQLKTARQGMSTPIQIRIRIPQGKYDNNGLNDLLFYDLTYITQQIFSFTYLSWRSFLPGEQPATMLYSNLIARLLSKLRNVPEWDADKLNYGLKRKKWFL